MKKLLVLFILTITACSPKDELSITDENKLFSVTKETALLVCGGKSRLIENKNEGIIKVEIKDSLNTENSNQISVDYIKSKKDLEDYIIDTGDALYIEFENKPRGLNFVNEKIIDFKTLFFLFIISL